MDTSPVSKLDSEHLDKVIRLRPEAATELGLLRDGDRWGDVGTEADAVLADTISTWADARANVDASEMSARDVTHLSMDQTVLEGSLRMLRLTLDQAGPSRADPDVLSPRLALLVRQAYQLTSTAEGVDAYVARLSTLGAALEQARGATAAADAHLLARARQRAAVAKAALSELTTVVVRQHEDRTAMLPRLQQAEAEAAKAIDATIAWLNDLASEPGATVFGDEGTAALLDDRRLEMTADDVEDLCRSHIEQMRIEQRRLRRRAFKRLSLEEALSTSRSQTPYSAEEAAVWLSELAEQARQFCLETAYFPLTDDAAVVDDAPQPLFDLLGPLNLLPPTREPHGGPVLLVTDPGAPAGLARLSVADLEALCARYLFPGAGLHASLAVREHSWVRQGVALGVAPSLASAYGRDLLHGWHLHAQELMRELQFRESPAARLVLCERSLVDGLLGWFDMKLCRGQASFDEVCAALVEHGGLSEAEARRATTGLLAAPGQAAGAIVGKARISQLRRSARIRWRHGYAERRFHDFLLHAGALPVAVLFGLLDEFSPFSVDEGTVEYELDERPDNEPSSADGEAPAAPAEGPAEGDAMENTPPEH